MYPHERSLVKQLAGKPFEIVGVNSDSNLKTIRKIVEKKNLIWRSFQNESSTGTISDKWGIEGWPTVFLIDAEGVIRFKGHGVSDSKIEELMAEMGHEVNLVLDDPGEKEEEKEEEESEAEKDSDTDKKDSDADKKKRKKRTKKDDSGE